LVGIPVNRMLNQNFQSYQHSASDKYVEAVMRFGDATPILIAAVGDAMDFEETAAMLDGLVLTGGRANVEPYHYGGPPFPDDEITDPARDATVLPLVRECVKQGVPIFGVCRGIQEMNVALGGTLHYRVHLLPGKMDHRMLQDVTHEERLAPRHGLTLLPGGYLSELLDGETECVVNSLHGQCIDKPAPGMVVEGHAHDGVIEAIRLETAKTFCVGVQWHAEWQPEEHKLYGALFRAFGEACTARLARRTGERRAAVA
jgi:putative glutamine amidotransferase